MTQVFVIELLNLIIADRTANLGSTLLHKAPGEFFHDMGRMCEVRLDFVIGHMCYRLYHVVLNCTEREVWVCVDSINNITGKLDLDVAA